jgi:hypothetical protein
LPRSSASRRAEEDVAEVEVDRFDSDVVNNLPIEDVIPGWVKPGEWKIKLHYDKTQSAAVFALLGLQKRWLVTLPDASTYAFKGFIKKPGREIPLKDKMTVEVTIRINGGSVQTFTAGA